MSSSDLFSILQPVSIEEALSAYFERLGGTRFYFDGGVTADEVFDRRSFLPLVANIADSRKKLLFGGKGLGLRFRECQDAVLGYEVIFEDSRTDSLTAMLMVSAAEDLFGPPADRQVDLMPIWKYFTASPEERLSMALPDYSQGGASDV